MAMRNLRYIWSLNYQSDLIITKLCSGRVDSVKISQKEVSSQKENEMLLFTHNSRIFEFERLLSLNIPSDRSVRPRRLAGQGKESPSKLFSIERDLELVLPKNYGNASEDFCREHERAEPLPIFSVVTISRIEAVRWF